MSGTPLLRASGLRVAQGGVQVLDVPDLDVDEGSVLALLGPNGSGKTTLLKTLAGLLEPVRGGLAFRGDPLATRAQRDAYRRRVTMVFQQPLLFDATVRANLHAGLRLRGLPRAQREPRVLAAASRLGIVPLLDRSARSLSGGEAQRTSLARAFALEPEILFLDEPFSALDPPAREALLEDLQGVLRQTGTTVVLATHHPGDAVRLAGTVAVLREGRIVQRGPASQVANRPADPFVAGFLGMSTLVPGTVLACGEGLARVAAGSREVLALGEASPGERVTLGIRPENVTLGPVPEGGPGPRNDLPGRIVRIVPQGAFCRVDLDCGLPLAAFATPWSLQERGLVEGGEAFAGFKASSVHLIRGAGEEREGSSVSD